MAKTRVTDVTLELDKPRRFLFDLNAFIELEEIYGSKEEAFEAVKTGKLKHIITVIWAGLVHEDRNLKVEDLARMLSYADPDIVTELADLILKASTAE